MSIFDTLESEVRSYCRSFPAVFDRAKGSHMFTEDGKDYIDFFDGAGALSYGHNNTYIMNAIADYIRSEGITHALDLSTRAKREFLETFRDKVLVPGGLDYKVMFCGSTGTNSVEAALKLARKVKKRQNIFAFSGAFHGMTLGALACTSDEHSRGGAGVAMGNVTFMPFPFGFNKTFDTIGYIENVLTDDHSGIDKPAAIILETVQAEGGVCVTEIDWLRRLRDLCDRHDILLICDEIQVGCGRTGTFFSFQRAGIVPDMVTVSKSISGAGLPMSLLLLKPEIDIWTPAEHNGTFRGNQLAFVGAKAALEYMDANDLLSEVKRKAEIVESFVQKEILPLDARIELRGLGLIQGIEFAAFDDDTLSKRITAKCFENGLVIERAGRKDSVVKILPALTIDDADLIKGLEIIRDAVKAVL